jgi:hypothetical protein
MAFPGQHVCSRPGDYKVIKASGSKKIPIYYLPPANGIGKELGTDKRFAACWIDTPSLSGIVYGKREGYGYVWYGNGEACFNLSIRRTWPR